tara:strand:+ start:677 stop:988 length:312 start_codon:yes stop_codon:yes gene_type:complete
LVGIWDNNHTEQINQREQIMDTRADMYKELYDEKVIASAEISGELAGMAFVAQTLIDHIIIERNVSTYKSDRCEQTLTLMKKTLNEYYSGQGSLSPFAKEYKI